MMPDFFGVSPLEQYEVPDEVCLSLTYDSFGVGVDCRFSGPTARSWERMNVSRGYKRIGTLMSPKMISSVSQTSAFFGLPFALS